MWFIAVPLPFLKLPPDVLPLLFVQSLMTVSLCYTFIGYNAMYGTSQLKSYGHHHLHANVIRQLRLHPSLDETSELLIQSLSCN